MEAQEYQKCRIRKFYFFNTTFGLRAIYALVSPFLDKVTKDKTQLKKEAYNDELLEFAHPSQIEEKYGGEAENLTEWWPPRCPSEEYDVDPAHLDIPKKTEKRSKKSKKNAEKQEKSTKGSSPNKPVEANDVVFETIEAPQEQPMEEERVKRPAPRATKDKNCACTIF